MKPAVKKKIEQIKENLKWIKDNAPDVFQEIANVNLQYINTFDLLFNPKKKSILRIILETDESKIINILDVLGRKYMFELKETSIINYLYDLEKKTDKAFIKALLKLR